ncbi:hypoxia inducible factor prolyl hydroxylase, putative [Babesia caballi]|uniref:Hypoxia inducible factor prolyl hydroxylase, putative n=1 Tax=Babesia caballi TaxID=5871 RepID=A0AAV4LZZ5_BABCB|nr:hypoxia inducible factor prolyl hydroxylase, putative [Babesia caballi]
MRTYRGTREGDLDVLVGGAGEQHVFGLQVGVNQPVLLQEGEALEELEGDLLDVGHEEALVVVALHEVVERVAQVLKDQAHDAVLVEEVAVEDHAVAVPARVHAVDVVQNVHLDLGGADVLRDVAHHLDGEPLAVLLAEQHAAEGAVADLVQHLVVAQAHTRHPLEVDDAVGGALLAPPAGAAAGTGVAAAAAALGVGPPMVMVVALGGRGVATAPVAAARAAAVAVALVGGAAKMTGVVAARAARAGRAVGGVRAAAPQVAHANRGRPGARGGVGAATAGGAAAPVVAAAAAVVAVRAGLAVAADARGVARRGPTTAAGAAPAIHLINYFLHINRRRGRGGNGGGITRVCAETRLGTLTCRDRRTRRRDSGLARKRTSSCASRGRALMPGTAEQSKRNSGWRTHSGISKGCRGGAEYREVGDGEAVGGFKRHEDDAIGECVDELWHSDERMAEVVQDALENAAESYERVRKKGLRDGLELTEAVDRELIATAWKQAFTKSLIKFAVPALQALCARKARCGDRLALSVENITDLEPETIYSLINDHVGVVRNYVSVDVGLVGFGAVGNTRQGPGITRELEFMQFNGVFCKVGGRGRRADACRTLSRVRLTRTARPCHIVRAGRAHGRRARENQAAQGRGGVRCGVHGALYRKHWLQCAGAHRTGRFGRGADAAAGSGHAHHHEKQCTIRVEARGREAVYAQRVDHWLPLTLGPKERGRGWGVAWCARPVRCKRKHTVLKRKFMLAGCDWGSAGISYYSAPLADLDALGLVLVPVDPGVLLPDADFAHDAVELLAAQVVAIGEDERSCWWKPGRGGEGRDDVGAEHVLQVRRRMRCEALVR